MKYSTKVYAKMICLYLVTLIKFSAKNYSLEELVSPEFIDAVGISGMQDITGANILNLIEELESFSPEVGADLDALSGGIIKHLITFLQKLNRPATRGRQYLSCPCPPVLS